MDAAELTRLVRDSVAGEIAPLRADVRNVSDSQIRLEEAVTNTSKSLDRLSDSLDNVVGELRSMTTAVAVQQSEIERLQKDSIEHGADLREQGQSMTRITTTIAVVGSIIAVVLIPVAIAAVQYILSQ